MKCTFAKVQHTFISPRNFCRPISFAPFCGGVNKRKKPQKGEQKKQQDRKQK